MVHLASLGQSDQPVRQGRQALQVVQGESVQQGRLAQPEQLARLAQQALQAPPELMVHLASLGRSDLPAQRA